MIYNAAMLSPMLFTHCSPSRIPEEAILSKTLQIYSIKIAKIKHLKWPLEVYGVVAARDYVDHKRNILFFRRRMRSQTLTKKVRAFYSLYIVVVLVAACFLIGT